MTVLYVLQCNQVKEYGALVQKGKEGLVVKAVIGFGSVLICVELDNNGFSFIFQVMQNHIQNPKNCH